jgi:WD40 repeat protein
LLACGIDTRGFAGVYRILKASDGTPVSKPVSFPGRVSDGCFVQSCTVMPLWDAESGHPRNVSRRHTGWVFSAAFNQDGKLLLTACQDWQARL